MLLNELALAACLALLLSTKIAVAAAARRADYRQRRVLLIFRLGLSFSACSYVLHLLGRSAPGPVSLLGLVCSFAGILLIWIGWMEHWSLSQQRAREERSLRPAEADDGRAAEDVAQDGAGLPVLNSQAHRVLRQAQAEAARRRQDCVDTDHLLLGLLGEPAGAGAHILDALGVDKAKIYAALGQLPEGVSGLGLPLYSVGPPADKAPPLSERARQVFALAAQEAHRFEKSSVGAGHLLLGLVLMGKGTAAAALFQEGVTVERIRNEMLNKRAA